jgi:predicted metalloprotease with PDZ domain
MQALTKFFIITAGLLLATSAARGETETTRSPGTASYKITIPQDNHRIAIVKATLRPTDKKFYMFPGANQLPKRWSTFVSDFKVNDENDQPISVTAMEDGSWQLSAIPQGRVTFSYRVNLEHENHSWNGGVDGAAYLRDWGVFYTARSLFVANGEERDDISVEFDLPERWRVTTPWQIKDDERRSFRVTDYENLSMSMFFAGTHKEVVVRKGPFRFLLALGGDDILAQENDFVDMTKGVLDYYVGLMGDVPRLQSQDAAGTPVVIINQAEMTDGEAIGNNISILLERSGGQMSQDIARMIFAHEFFHLWNGKSFAPSGEDAEWFKEGFTNYYSLKALHHIGYLSDESFLGLLAGFFYKRYDADSGVGTLSMTSGELKHDHWGLIYSGGMLIAIAQDLQIRSATGNESSLDDLMRFMFDEYSANAYDLGDVERALGGLNNTSQQDFFDRYIRGVERIPVAQFLALADIEISEEDGRTVFSVRDGSGPDQGEIRRGLFGD